LCADAGLASVGITAIDGTKVHANANRDRTLDFAQLARTIIEEAIELDAAETAGFDGYRGEELPELSRPARAARGWLRAAGQRLDRDRGERSEPIPRSRPQRLRDARHRLEEDHPVERDTHEQYEAYLTPSWCTHEGLDPGLQRAGRLQRAPPDHGRRSDDRLAGVPRGDAGALCVC